MLIAALFLSACTTNAKSVAWSELPTSPAENLMEQLTPVWQQGPDDARLDIRIYLQPADKSTYVFDTLKFLISLPDARVRIYDYPAQAEVEGIMLAGIGECIADKDPALYPLFLQTVASSKENVQDELVMASIAKQVLSENYSRTCLQKKIKGLKAVFENDNPLDLTTTPATVINGKIVYGDLSSDEWKSLLAGVEAN
jgi:hypothetical protein